MKKEVMKKIFNDIKYKLVSEDLAAISKSFQEEGRKPRDFIGVETLSQVFKEMARERSNKNEPN